MGGTDLTSQLHEPAQARDVMTILLRKNLKHVDAKGPMQRDDTGVFL